ncbi:type I restriction-modification system methyltransferase subunit [Streptococcus pneumoniae]|nr:type I restriction-modification system methyltransferase subunit [Streptococcus pneumoniae]VTQ35828.1 HsdM N-terminal domain [Haemophilus haemolyticus]CVQ22777.1 type I restriction-modification system methyltransferase subunit [Streptococcus pneumoniae]CVV33299.1 type I restriction-modification system methyltransferase subunit [Streptococcus pneumoniae]CVV79411.1 type I restriction-modification system methyltransferase subunit [Streptococcus pneumoniae]
MITGELKNKIDQLWEILWTEGNANPLTNIEQLTYLLFMKDLDSVELGRESDAEFLGIPYEGVFPKDKPEYRWSTFNPNHSYLSQLDVTYKTPDLMSHFLPPHEVSFTFCCSSIVFPR